jgi:type I restriction enzyme S subunit
MLTNWKQCTLGDIITLQRGFDLPERERQKGSIPIVSSSGVTGYHNLAKVQGPGVVTGRYGTLGEVFFIKDSFWPLNTTLFVRDFKGNDPLFLSYFLRTLNLAHQNSAGAVPGVNRNALHLLPVYVPSPPIQRKIASVLSAYDDLIDNNTRRIAILEQMARMLYQEWFVQFRFPGYEQVKMVESELGMIPEGWGVRAIGDVAGVNLLNIQNNNELEEIYYVDIASVQVGQITNVELMLFHQAPNRARRVVKHGDIIWSMVRPNRKSYSLILSPPENLIVSTGFAVISAQFVPYTYLYLATTTDDFTKYLTNHATGSAYPAVNARDFLVARLLVPPQDLLSKFHSMIESNLLQKQILLRKNANLRRTRDLLLPKLISGEIDVSSWADGVAEAEQAVAVTAQGRGEVREEMPSTPIDVGSLEQRSLWG